MKLNSDIFSLPLLVILPFLIKKVVEGPVKELISIQVVDKRSKTDTDGIILTGPTGIGLSSILNVMEDGENYVIVPVITTRPPRKEDKTRLAITDTEFYKLGTLVYLQEYNNYRYGVLPSDLDNAGSSSW